MAGEPDEMNLRAQMGSRNAQALHQRIRSQFVTHSAIQSIIGALRPG